MIFSHDLETDLVQPGLAAPPHVVGSYADETGSHILEEARCVPWFRERLERGDRLIGCGYSFDLGVMCAADPRLVKLVFDALEAKLIHDVGIRETLIDIATGAIRDTDDDEMGERYGMRVLSERYFNEDIRQEKKGADSWRRRYALLRGVPIERWPWAARRYILRDAAKPLEIYRLQEGRPNVHAEFWNVRAMFAFQLMSIWGLRTNRPKVTALEQEVEDEWQATRRELAGAGIFREDKKKGFVQDKKRTAELVTAAYGDPPRTAATTKFPEGQVATDRDTLAESGDPLLVKLANAGKNDKRRSTYLPILKAGLDVPWNPIFNALVATGRASGDAQQFPTGARSKGGIRECFCPRHGFCFCSVDYEGLELRTMSQIAIWKIGWSRMAQVLNAKDDPHTIAAAQMMGIHVDEAKRLKDAEDPRFKTFRNLGKIFNFGAGGGMGAGSLTYNAREKDGVRFCVAVGEQTEEQCRTGRKVQVRVKGGKLKGVCARCLDLAKKFRAAWTEAWPEQKELFRRATLEVDGKPQGVDVLIPGADIVRGRCGYSKVLNNPFQGIGGRIAKEWTWRVSREMHTDPASPLWGSHLVLMVHDELVAELLLERKHEAAMRISEIGKQVGCEFLPDLAPAMEAPPAISMVMAKDMKTVFNAAGRLELWEPKKAA